jgi:hypothetical protein
LTPSPPSTATPCPSPCYLFTMKIPPLTLTLSHLWVERGCFHEWGGDQIPVMMVCAICCIPIHRTKSLETGA